jgi:hypothetical protein
MAVGQVVLAGVWDVPALRAAEDRLEARAVDAGRVRAALLRDVLVVHGQYSAVGLALSSQAQVALLLRCSELRAGRLLHDALGLAELPEALAALEWGLLRVEQSSVVVSQLAVLSLPDRLRVWERLLGRLRRDVEQGAVLPPARLAELLRGWVVEVDSGAARERREQAARGRRVEYRRREDGLADVFLFGIEAPLAQAVLQRVRQEAAPVGLWDERTADQRRLDAAVDLLLGRSGGGCDGVCGCLPGTPAVCGAEVAVLVPWATALGAGEVPAEPVGHGPVDTALLQDLLANAPRLRAVLVDEHGVPVAVGERVLTPERGDPVSLRRALLELSEMTPGRWHPRHPDDHRPEPGSGQDPELPGQPPPSAAVVLARAALGPALPSSGAHPTDQPGGYRVPRRLRRLIGLRAPRCEFPGCGARATRCDAEHDLAWPAGPTCACNLGPCCRRHHRVKQEGWRKTRTADGVRWTTVTGRSWLSRHQHQPPQPPARSLPPTATTASPWDELDPADLDELLWILDGRPDDPVGWELRAEDRAPDDVDLTQQQILHGDTRWTLDLSDPYAWLEASTRAL